MAVQLQPESTAYQQGQFLEVKFPSFPMRPTAAQTIAQVLAGNFVVETVAPLVGPYELIMPPHDGAQYIIVQHRFSLQALIGNTVAPGTFLSMRNKVVRAAANGSVTTIPPLYDGASVGLDIIPDVASLSQDVFMRRDQLNKITVTNLAVSTLWNAADFATTAAFAPSAAGNVIIVNWYVSVFVAFTKFFKNVR